MNIQDINFTILDTETTGNREGDKPIQVAAIQINFAQGIIKDPVEWLINPQKPIHPSAMGVHHITDEMVANKPTLEEVLPEIQEYVKNSVIIAHNSPFDSSQLPMLKETWLDTLRLARHLWNINDINEDGHDLSNHKNQTLRYWLKLNIDTLGRAPHDAIADVLVTKEIFIKEIETYLERYKNNSFEDFKDFANAPILIETFNFGKHKDKTIQQVIETDLSYLSWYIHKIETNSDNKDEDLKYSLKYFLKQNSYDYNELFLAQERKEQSKEKKQQKFNSWESFADSTNKKGIKKW